MYVCVRIYIHTHTCVCVCVCLHVRVQDDLGQQEEQVHAAERERLAELERLAEDERERSAWISFWNDKVYINTTTNKTTIFFEKNVMCLVRFRSPLFLPSFWVAHAMLGFRLV